jgi:hypothetical protein
MMMVTLNKLNSLEEVKEVIQELESLQTLEERKRYFRLKILGQEDLSNLSVSQRISLGIKTSIEDTYPELERRFSVQELIQLSDTVIEYMLDVTPQNLLDLFENKIDIDYNKIEEYLINLQDETISILKEYGEKADKGEEIFSPAIRDRYFMRLNDIRTLLQENNLEEFKALIRQRLNEFFELEELEGDQLAKLIGNSVRESATVDPNKKMRALIKLWLSLIPDNREYRHTRNGLIKPFVPLYETIYYIEHNLAGIEVDEKEDVLDEMIRRLSKTKATFAPMNYIIETLEDENTPEKFKTQFVRTFNRTYVRYTSLKKISFTERFGDMVLKSFKLSRIEHDKRLENLENIRSFWKEALNREFTKRRKEKDYSTSFINEKIDKIIRRIDGFGKQLDALREEYRKEANARGIKNPADTINHIGHNFYRELGYTHPVDGIDLLADFISETLTDIGLPVNTIKFREALRAEEKNIHIKNRDAKKKAEKILGYIAKKLKEAADIAGSNEFKKSYYPLTDTFEFFHFASGEASANRIVFDVFSTYSQILSATFQESHASFDGNTYYPYNNADFLHKFFNEMMTSIKGAYAKMTAGFRSKIFTSHSPYLFYFLGLSSDENRNSSSKDMTLEDDIISRLTMYNGGVNPAYPYLTLADKSRMYYMKGNIVTPKKRSLESFVTNLVIDELNLVNKAYENVFGENKLPEEKLVLNYHYKLGENGEKIFRDENGMPVGSAFTSGFFGEFLTDSNLFYQEGELKGKPKLDNIQDNSEIEKYIEETLAPKLVENIKEYNLNKLVEAGLVAVREDGYYDIQGIPMNIVNKGHDAYGDEFKKVPKVGTKEEMNFLLSTLSVLHLVHLSQALIVHGHLGYYKTFENFMKRTPEVSATGEFLRIHKTKWGEVRPKYNLALMTNKFKETSEVKETLEFLKERQLVDFFDTLSKNEEILSYIKDKYNISTEEESFSEVREFLLSNSKALKDAYKKVTGKSLSDVDVLIDETISEYERVNKADAQGVITPKRWKEIAIGLYGWSDTLEEAYQRAVKGKASADDLRTLLNHLPLHSLKGQHYEVLRHNDELIPVYIKYSQFPLFPQFVNNSKGAKYLKLMEKSGTDELVVLDGSKAASFNINTFNSPDEYLLSGKTLNNIELSNRYWKLQQENPYHSKDEVTLGVQVRRNLLANLEHPIKVKDKTLSPKEYLNELNRIDNELSNRNSKKVSYTLGLQKYLGLDIIKKSKFYEGLSSMFNNNDDSPTIRELIKTKQPLDAFGSLIKQVEYKIFAKIRKAAIRFKEGGNSLIQVSPEFFEEDSYSPDNTYADLSKETQGGVVWLKDRNLLEPPQVITDEEGNQKVTYGQILISESFVDRIPGYHSQKKKLSKEEFAKWLNERIDQDSLRLLGYRIPNQKLSFNQPLEIVGILPKEVGNSIVAYSEIAVQTGSDYDIDKMFTLMPTLRWDSESNILKPVEFSDKEEELEKRYNLMMENEWKLLPEFKEKMSSLENSEEIIKLKEEISEEVYKAAALSQEVRDKLNSLDEEDFFEAFKIKERSLLEINKALNILDIISDIQEQERLIQLKRKLEKELNSKVSKQLEEIAVKELIEEGVIPDLETFATWDIFAQNTKEALSNRRLQLYLGRLTTPEYYLDLVSSVDTSFLKDNIYTLYEKDTQVPNYLRFSTVEQAVIRKEFMDSKAGVGMTAVAQAKLIYSQFLEFFSANFSKDRFYTKEYKVEKTSEGTYKLVPYRTMYITDVLSAFMNAFVDAAKDNYIGKAKVTPEVQSFVYYLIGEGAPSILPIAVLKNKRLQQTIKTKNSWKQVVNTSYERAKPVELTEQSQATMKEEGINLGEMTNIEKAEFILNNEGNPKYQNIVDFLADTIYTETMKEVNMLVPFSNFLRVDVDGAKKNTRELISNLFTLGKDITGNIDRIKNNLTFLKSFAKNTYNTTLSILSSQRFILSQKGIELLEDLYKDIGDSITKEGTIGKIDNEILNAFYITKLRKELGWSDEAITSLIVGDNSIGKQLTELQNTLTEEDDGYVLINNLTLSTDVYRTGIPRMKFIQRTEAEIANIKKDWRNMARNDETKDFAYYLGIVALYTYGVGGGANNLASYIPEDIMHKLGLRSKSFATFLEEVRSGEYNEVLKDQLVRHLAHIPGVIQKVKANKLKTLSTGHIYIHDSVMEGNKINLPGFKYPVAPKYLTTTKTINGIERTVLLKLVGNVHETQELHPGQVEVLSPRGYIYAPTQPLGVVNKYNNLILRDYNLKIEDKKSISTKNPDFEVAKEVTINDLIKSGVRLGNNDRIIKPYKKRVETLTDALTLLDFKLPAVEEVLYEDRVSLSTIKSPIENVENKEEVSSSENIDDLNTEIIDKVEQDEEASTEFKEDIKETFDTPNPTELEDIEQKFSSPETFDTDIPSFDSGMPSFTSEEEELSKGMSFLQGNLESNSEETIIFENLSQEEKNKVLEKGYTEATFNSLSEEMKKQILTC